MFEKQSPYYTTRLSICYGFLHPLIREEFVLEGFKYVSVVYP